MPLTPIEFPRTAGLNVTDDAQELGGAAIVDGVNFDTTTPGIIRTRPGQTTWTSAAAVADYQALLPFYGAPTNPNILLGAAGNKLFAYDAGTQIATKTLLATATETSMVSIGIGGSTAASSKRVYINTDGESVLQRFDGSIAFTATAVDRGRVIALQQPDNRLVIGGYQLFDSRVAFSDPAAPETFGANNYVDLTPGNGERIVAIASYGTLTIVFKKSSYYVFYGNGVDGSGNPIFNYKPVFTGIGCISPQGVAVGPDGVYFVHYTGVYRTTGGPPELVSRALNPLFGVGAVSPYYTGGLFSPAESSWPTVLAVGNSRLYLSILDGNVSAYRTFVLDFNTGQWMKWDINARAMVLFSPTNGIGAMYYADYNASHWLRLIAPILTQDFTGAAASNITGNYRTGYWNPGQPGAEAIVREWLVDGAGSVTFKTAVNDTVTLGSGATVTLGTYPATTQGRDRRSVRGRNVSFDVSGTGPWSVSRVVANLRGQRNAGLKAT